MKRDDFVEHLQLANSNIPEHGDGRTTYEKFVRPAMLNTKNVASHCAISSLFHEIDARGSIYS
ncbi:MAG: DUF3536 domain-containing protein [Desulfomonilaceae bacterium]